MLKTKKTIPTSLSCMIWKPLLQFFWQWICWSTRTSYVFGMFSWFSQLCFFFNDVKEQIDEIMEYLHVVDNASLNPNEK